MIKSTEIRNSFLNFFKSKGHQVENSSPMVIKNDPTLMFTNAGMNQFKDIFLDVKQPVSKRVANSQKCLRVSGKHNDLEEVGVDTYHHTMFEMLGNWSFGDYFKEDAINWAWEFLVDVMKIDKDRLYVTVFEGDKVDGTIKDQEAYDFWKKYVDESRILNGNKKDNFWEMGATGPCGPCSEIHVDIRNEEDRELVDGKSLVNMDHPQVIEVWNLVFMQFNRSKDGSLVNLKNRHVDTGMGLERLCMVVQAVQSNYDTDLFQDAIKSLEKDSGLSYTQSDSKQDVAFRVIADHVRAVAFSICDGQLPSNTGAGYVIRRILRRAVRYGYSFLNYQEPFIYKLVDVLVENLGDHFQELNKQKELITKVIKEEEDGFLRTLAKGIQRFNSYEIKNDVIDGKFAFELYDTFGFPIDLTELLASEKGAKIDMTSFEENLKAQKDRSRKATAVDTGDWSSTSDEIGGFIGYDRLNEQVEILKSRVAKQKKGEVSQVVLSKSPFYPEGGGQVGDTGKLTSISGELIAHVVSTKKENGLIISTLDKVISEDETIVLASVDISKRNETQKNHSATHLLHHALRNLLGDHVEQKGSLVNADYLRFDFSHFQKVTDEELELLSEKVNEEIAKSIIGSITEEDIEIAKEKGAIALFGEKYEDKVRVVEFGDSIELCGGCHVKNTSEIGRFIIKSEGSVAAGVRRIEAITGKKADEYINNKVALLNQVNSLMGEPKDLVKSIEKLAEEHKELTKKVEDFLKEKTSTVKANLLSKVQRQGEVNLIIEKVDLDSSEGIKNIAFQLKSEVDNLFMVIGTSINGKPNLTVVVNEDLSKANDLNAGKIIRELAKEIRGGGGGQPFYATAGGSDLSGLDKALEVAKGLTQELA